MNAPDLRPTATTDSAATMETGTDHQLEHLNDGELLAKVLPAGGPLQVVTAWVCPVCGSWCRGGPPPECMEPGLSSVCPARGGAA